MFKDNTTKILAIIGYFLMFSRQYKEKHQFHGNKCFRETGQKSLLMMFLCRMNDA